MVKISDIVSYEFYIQVKKLMWSFSEEGLDHAMRLANQALEISGDNALLLATRSLIFWQYQNTGVRPTPEVLNKADHDAARAIEIDPSCSLGYRAKASVALTRGELERKRTGGDKRGGRRGRGRKGEHRRGRKRRRGEVIAT